MIGSKRLARIAGAFYLAIIGFGIFAELTVRQSVLVSGDAAATSANILADASLFRLGIAADIVMALAYIGAGLALAKLFRGVSRDGARLIAAFAIAGATMILVNLVLQAGALLLATEPSYAEQMGAETANSMTLLFMEMHGHLYTYGGVFFGLWLLPIGLMIVRSRAFPRFLGYALTAAAASYLVLTVVEAAWPGFGSPWVDIIDAPTVIGEFWLVGYLVSVGRRADHKIPEVIDA